jgi:Glyoxalase-like domain
MAITSLLSLRQPGHGEEAMRLLWCPDGGRRGTVGITLDRVLIDHLVYAVPSLPAAVAGVAERFGVRAQAGGKHLGLGTHNALLALGPRTYLEIIAPDPEQPETSRPRPFGLDGVSHGRLAGWALACDDIDAAVARARSRGYDPGDVTDGRRVGPTGTALQWRMTISRTAGGLVPFLINWGDTEHPAASAPRGLSLEACHIEHPEPGSLAPLLAALGADVQIKPAAAAALVARLGGPNGSTVLR